MTAKEKAIQMVEKYYGITDVNFGISKQKQCALIAVNEILKIPSIHEGRMIPVIKEDYDYWKEVKKHIENL